jgi:hypothetical protein
MRTVFINNNEWTLVTSTVSLMQFVSSDVVLVNVGPLEEIDSGEFFVFTNRMFFSNNANNLVYAKSKARSAKVVVLE